MNVDEFLAYCETQEKGRYELLRGEIVAMAPERAGHARAKAQGWRALADAIKAAGAPCETFVDGLGVAFDVATCYQPDALLNCGETLAPDATLAPSPVIIVEVASPSTPQIDSSVKLADYFKLPSLSHYLIVDAAARRLALYRRGADGALNVANVSDGPLRLDPPGLTVEIAAFFG